MTAVTAAPNRAEAVERYRSAVADIPEVLELVADVCQAPMAALKVAGDTAAHFAAAETPVLRFDGGPGEGLTARVEF